MNSTMRIAASGGTPMQGRPDGHLGLIVSPIKLANQMYEALERRCRENPHYPRPQELMPRNDDPYTVGRETFRRALQPPSLYPKDVRVEFRRMLRADCPDVNAVFTALGRIYLTEQEEERRYR
ncbi:MAG TPA: hypothetical protein VJC16_03935 [Candidatus Nanoarchaeia archaeon]|nr:hypothetical protein [Candidatus Nanoarchaeia archaeon]